MIINRVDTVKWFLCIVIVAFLNGCGNRSIEEEGVVHGTAPSEANRTEDEETVLWTAPVNEEIRYIRNGRTEGTVLILTQANDKWVLREIDGVGNVTECASGNGILQAAVPLSTLDWKRERVLVGVMHVFNENSEKEYSPQAVLCNVVSGKTEIIPDSRIITSTLQQPFSPDGKLLVWLGYSYEAKHNGVWVMDIKTGKNTLVVEGRDSFFAGWTRDGLLYLYSNEHGELLFWNGSEVVESRPMKAKWGASMAPDGSVFITCPYSDKEEKAAVVCWDTKDWSSKTFTAPRWTLFMSPDWSPNNRKLGVPGDGQRPPLVIDIENGVSEIEDFSDYYYGLGVAFLSDSSVTVVDKEPEGSGRILVRDLTVEK